MISKILSIYCLNNVVITVENALENGSTIPTINKLLIKPGDFEELIQAPYGVFVEELNKNVASYTEDILNRDNFF